MRIYFLVLLVACASRDNLRSPASIERTCAEVLKNFLQDITGASPRVAPVPRSLLDFQRDFATALNKAPRKQAGQIQRAFDSLYFIDYEHSGARLFAASQGEEQKAGVFERLWDKLVSPNGKDPGLRVSFEGIERLYQDAAFQRFTEARDFLRSSQQASFNVDLIRETHRRTMKGGIEGLPADRLGVTRSVAIIGNTGGQTPTAEAIRALNENVYASWDPVAKQILYPTVENLKPAALGRLEHSDPPLWAEVTAIRTRLAAQQSIPIPANLTQRLMDSLVDERMKWFVRQRTLIGDLDDATKVAAYVRLVADFTRDFVSIHLFENGNGRTSRLVMGYLLEQRGIPAPRLFDTDADLFAPPEKWASAVEAGILNSARLYEDLTKRLTLGLPLENSAELLNPNLLRSVAVDLKKAGSIKVVPDQRKAELASQQFLAYLRTRLSTDPSLAETIRRDPVKAMTQLKDDYGEFAKRTHVDFIHAKEGLEFLDLNLVDPDFLANFGRVLSAHPELWKAKMAAYSDEVVWRGISYQQAVDETEILSMFRSFHTQFVSENVKHRMGGRASPDALRKLIVEDFGTYNRELVAGDMYKMAVDHSESGPRYATSYGYSTSKNRTVGKAFAMGAMVVAEYGKQKDFQHLLADRILVGMRRAPKDVDLGRLKQLEPRFSYKYGRQQEVMGIGAADPDSISVVQRLGADGEVIETYARNPDNPGEILVLRGQYDAEAGQSPDPASITRRISL